MRELEPQRAAARQTIGETESALPMWTAKRQMEADKLKADQFALSQEEFKHKQAQDKAAAAAAAAKRDRSTYVDPATGDTATVAIGPDGKATAIDGAGNPTGMDITKLVPYDQYIAVQNAKAKKSGKSELTQNQLRQGLKDYRARIDELAPIIQGVNSLDATLAGLDNPNKNIPGIGAIEGGTGPIASVTRYAKDLFSDDQQAQNIHSTFTQSIAPLIREQAGLAQTQIELARVEQQFGATWLNDENVFRQQYPKIKAAIKRDLEALHATTLPQVRDYYAQQMQQAGAPTVYDRAKFADPFEPKQGYGTEIPVVYTPEQLSAMSDEELDAVHKATVGGGAQ
jgi:hypothetical protein